MHCTTADSCLDDIHHALSILGANSDDVVHGDPFDPIDPPDGTQGSPLCRHCAARVIKRGKEAQKILWTELPSFLEVEVEGWPSASSHPSSDEDEVA